MLTSSSVLANEEFKQELNQAAQVLEGTSKQTADSIEGFDKQLKKLRKTQEDNVKQQEKLNKELENSKLPAFFKEMKELKTNIEGINAQIQSTDTKITTVEDEKQIIVSKKEQENIDKKIAEKQEKAFQALGLVISEAELTRRKEFDENIKIKKEELELAKKARPEAGTEIDKELKNIKVKEEKEQVRRDKQQTSVFAKGFQGLQNKFDDFGKSLKGKGITALKTGLFIAAYFALAKFLQSDAFKKTVAFIYNVIIPNIKEIGIVIGVLAGLLVVSKIASIISGMITAFKIIKGALIATKIALGLASVPLAPIIAIVAAIALGFMAIKAAVEDFETTLKETGSVSEALKAGAAKLIAFVVGYPADLMFKLIGFIAGIFGFDNFKAEIDKLDPIGEVAKSLRNFFTAFGDVFTRIVAGAKAFIGAMVKGIFTGESPMEAFNRAYDAKATNADDAERLGMAPGETFGENMLAGGKNIKAESDSVTIDKELKQGGGMTVINNNVVTTNSSEEHMGVAIKNGRDESNEYRMVN